MGRIDATEILFCAHEEGQGHLHYLDEAARGLQAGETAQPLEAIAGVLTFFDTELPIHFLHEEEGLFPVLEGIIGREGVLSELEEEHQILWQQVADFKDKVQRLDKAREEDRAVNACEVAEAACKITELLRNHIYKEDYVLFPEAERRFTPEQWDEVSLLMEAAEDRYLAQRQDALEGACSCG